jgi:hypothetical protein
MFAWFSNLLCRISICFWLIGHEDSRLFLNIYRWICITLIVELCSAAIDLILLVMFIQASSVFCIYSLFYVDIRICPAVVFAASR